MTHLTIELLLWMLLMFFIGCILSCLLRRIFSAEQGVATAAHPDTDSQSAAQRVTSSPAAAESGAADPEPVEPLETSLSPEPEPEPEEETKPSSASITVPKPASQSAVQKAEPIPAKSEPATSEPETIKTAITESVAVETTPIEPVEASAPVTPLVAIKSTEPENTPKPKPQVAAEPIGNEYRPKGLAAAQGGKADNLQKIYGIGPVLEKVLHELGFFHFHQIAGWSSKEEQWVDEHLQFKGRIGRDEWIAQAKLLAEDDTKQFAALYGSGGLPGADGQTKPGARTRRGRNVKS